MLNLPHIKHPTKHPNPVIPQKHRKPETNYFSQNIKKKKNIYDQHRHLAPKIRGISKSNKIQIKTSGCSKRDRNNLLANRGASVNKLIKKGNRVDSHSKTPQPDSAQNKRREDKNDVISGFLETPTVAKTTKGKIK